MLNQTSKLTETERVDKLILGLKKLMNKKPRLIYLETPIIGDYQKGQGNIKLALKKLLKEYEG